jgi:hypothetical protein
LRPEINFLLVDGMTAANDLGLTDAVPARITIPTDGRRRAVTPDNLVIEFKLTAPNRLYWAGWPAMRVVHALHWLKAPDIGQANFEQAEQAAVGSCLWQRHALGPVAPGFSTLANLDAKSGS